MVVPTICPPESILTMLLNEHCSKRTRRTAKASQTIIGMCLQSRSHLANRYAKLRAIGIQAIIFVTNPGFEEGISVGDFAGLKITS